MNSGRAFGLSLGWLVAVAAFAGEPAGISTPASSGRSLPSYVLFETGHVRPLALSSDGRRLFAVNTPDGRLEVFRAEDDRLSLEASVRVGLEPVAVALRRDDEAWVVNHLSDSVSIVDVGSSPPRVVRTLLVGDEPRDILFAGSERDRAFVTTAHRGQNSPADPALLAPSVPRADVWVFEADDLGASMGGSPLSVLSLFGDTPRALAASPDGSRVYAAVFLSGNRTTTVGVSQVAGTYSGDAPENRLRKAEPSSNVDGVEAPETGVIVRDNGEAWVDEAGTSFSAKVPFSLPDLDVFEIDANADPPAETGSWSGVGTTLFNLAVNPSSGVVYVSNSEARNDVRFEGPGADSTTVRGHVVEDRITVLRGDSVTARRLNSHVDHSLAIGEAIPASEKAKSLSQMLGMAVSPDGRTLYAAAFGSGKIAVLSTQELEEGTLTPDAVDRIELAGSGGPTGVVLSADGDRLFAMTRFDHRLHVVDTSSRVVLSSVSLFSPEPDFVVEGRPFHYDANRSSGNGTAACGSCHLFGDVDGLAWDLGNPDESVVPNPNPLIDLANVEDPVFHPMKGPMTTQTFRGIADSGPMHWRGDRTGLSDARRPGESVEMAAFKEFRGAFVGLLGRERELDESELDRYARFALEVTHPPNPIRNLDGSLTADQAEGARLFFEAPEVGFCSSCHENDPEAGRFTTTGESTNEAFFVSQEFKIPSLRNLYQKVGAFGGGALVERGPQVRGFGFFHDGSRGSLLDFIETGTAANFATTEDARRTAEFIFVADTNLAPIVGQQVTLFEGSPEATSARIDLMIAQASRADPLRGCDLVVHGVLEGAPRGWVFVGDDGFRSDRGSEPLATLPALIGHVESGRALSLTFTCAPPGTGVRIGVDRDLDGRLDRDELDAGTDPSDPLDPASSFTRSDCNGDGSDDISDALTLLGHLFGGEAGRPRCEDACDANDDGRLDISDAVFQLAFLFLEGDPIPPPFDECGVDESDDELRCRRFDACL